MVRRPRGLQGFRAWRFVLAASIALVFLIAAVPNPARACCVTATVTDTTTTPAVAYLAYIDGNGWGFVNGLLTNIAATLFYLTNTVIPATNGAIASAVTGSSMISTDWISKHADYTAGTTHYTFQVQNAAQYQAEAMSPSYSSACAVQSYVQAERSMDEDLRGVASSFNSLVGLGECKGVLANCNSPTYTREKIFDLCNLGFVPPSQNGDMFGAAGMNCPDISVQHPGAENGQAYIDAHNNMDLMLDTVQMPAASFCILPDGYPYFSGVMPPGMEDVACVGGTTLQAPRYDPQASRSQMAWVAAYKFCEGLAATPTTPVYTVGRPVTDVDYNAFFAAQKANMKNTYASPRYLCMTYLWERTAFPTTPGNGGPVANSVSSTATAAADQAAICKILFTSPNPTGADTAGVGGAPATLTDTGVGWGQSDALVQDCFNNGSGLSQLARQMSKAYRCGDTGYLPNLAGALGKHEEVEDTAQHACLADAEAFEDYRQHEKEALIDAMNSAAANEYPAGTRTPNLNSGGSPVR